MNLDDDMKAVDTILKRRTKKPDSEAPKSTGSSKFQKSMNDIQEKEKKRKKVDFSNMKTDGVKGDDVYEGQKDKLRNKKAARKDTEKATKVRIGEEVEQMGDAI
jgi:hypothetical protein